MQEGGSRLEPSLLHSTESQGAYTECQAQVGTGTLQRSWVPALGSCPLVAVNPQYLEGFGELKCPGI